MSSASLAIVTESVNHPKRVVFVKEMAIEDRALADERTQRGCETDTGVIARQE